MINLDDAIKHCLQKSIECKGECGYDHYQLAKWLAELRAYRVLTDSYLGFVNDEVKDGNNFNIEEIAIIKNQKNDFG